MGEVDPLSVPLTWMKESFERYLQLKEALANSALAYRLPANRALMRSRRKRSV